MHTTTASAASSATPRSLVLIEDLDWYLQGGGEDGEACAGAARMRTFMDGVASCCGEEHVVLYVGACASRREEGLGSEKENRAGFFLEDNMATMPPWRATLDVDADMAGFGHPVRCGSSLGT